MTDRYVDVNSQSNLHNNLNQVTQHFEVYGKGKKSKSRKRNKKNKTIFSEIKTLKKEN
tara:strand:+ start:536 stop:709 length:174 start_codon:yes stop_codon:yes gene_type:complete